MGLQVPALSPVNIDQAVYAAVAEQIISGALPPGTRVTEEELAAKLGVSRTPVREAIKALAKDELVELLPRRGVYVRQLSCDDVREIYETREALEGMAARLATFRVHDDELQSLLARTDACERELASGRIESWLEVDVALHALIMARCGNSRLSKTVNSLNNTVQYFRAQVARDRDRGRVAIGEHRRILKALMERNPDAVEAAAREHVAAGLRYLEKLCSHQQPTDELREAN